MVFYNLRQSIKVGGFSKKNWLRVRQLSDMRTNTANIYEIISNKFCLKLITYTFYTIISNFTCASSSIKDASDTVTHLFLKEFYKDKKYFFYQITIIVSTMPSLNVPQGSVGIYF